MKEILQDILSRFGLGKITQEAALQESLQQFSCRTAVDSIHGVCLDTVRGLRTGLTEVVFAQGKSHSSLLAAVEGLYRHGPVLVSRVDELQSQTLQKHFEQGILWPEARLFALDAPTSFERSLQPPWPSEGKILVVSAGAADLPVALEAYGTLCFWGIDCGFISDVGIAGLHRLSPHILALHKAELIIAVAGMEGALPGVLAGLVPTPVLAVPTSIGYGVGAGGKAALAAMLCSCVPGLAVLNIDNGFGAAAFAAKLLQKERAC